MKNKSIFDNKIVKIVFPLLLAFSLWLYVVTVVSPGSEEIAENIPVSISSERILWQRGLMIKSGSMQTVNVKLEGNRADLNKLDKSDIIVEMDLSGIYEAGSQHPTCNVRVPGNITAQIIGESIEIFVVERQEKQMPITVKFSGNSPDNYVRGKVTLDRDAVTVIGPKSLVNTVAEVAVTVDLNGHKDDIEQTLPIALLDRQGMPIAGLTVIDRESDK